MWVCNFCYYDWLSCLWDIPYLPSLKSNIYPIFCGFCGLEINHEDKRWLQGGKIMTCYLPSRFTQISGIYYQVCLFRLNLSFVIQPEETRSVITHIVNIIYLHWRCAVQFQWPWILNYPTGHSATVLQWLRSLSLHILLTFLLHSVWYRLWAWLVPIAYCFTHLHA